MKYYAPFSIFQTYYNYIKIIKQHFKFDYTHSYDEGNSIDDFEKKARGEDLLQDVALKQTMLYYIVVDVLFVEIVLRDFPLLSALFCEWVGN